MKAIRERFTKRIERRNKFEQGEGVGEERENLSEPSNICGSFSFDCCSLRSLFLFYSAFSSVGRIVRHETKFPARESDEEREAEIERE